MRGAKSLVYAVLLGRGWATLGATGAASTVLLFPSVASADPAANHVHDVRLRADDGSSGAAQIEIVGTGAPAYSVRVADGGRRLLIDLSDSDVVGAPAAITTGAGVVGGILTQSYPTPTGQMTRLTVTLQREASYRVVPDGTTLRVLLAPSGAAPVIDSKAPALPAPESTATVRDIRFERSSSGASICGSSACDRVVVDLGSIPAYSLAPSSTGRLRLELRATALPDGLARTLDVTAYRGALKSITASQDPATHAAVVEIDGSPENPGTLSVEGGLLVWTFPVPRSSAQAPPIGRIHIDGKAVGADGGVVRQVVTVAREAAPEDLPRIETSIHDEDPKVETSGGEAAGFASGDPGVLAQQRYNGRRIDIDLKDADIHNVLRLLADTGHVNVVTADDVTGTITIRMRNVPWDQVLDVVLQAKGLGMVRQGNLIRVAPLAQLQKERELKLAQQKQEFELTPLETRLIPISYAQASELQARAKELLSPRGSIAVDERTNVLIARDVAGNLNYIEELIRSLDTQTAQVLIEARIVEATSKYSRDVGIQWGGDVTFGPATGNPTGVAFPSSINVAGGNYDNNTPTAGLSPFTRNVATPNFAVNLPAAVGTGAGGALGMTFGSIDNTLNLSTAPLGRRVERPGAHRERAARHGPRQPRGAHQPGHPHPLRAGQRARRPDDVPGGQAAAPREAARHGRRLRLDAREAQPRRAGLQPDQPARRPDDPQARGRDRPARDGRPHGGHRRHLHAQHRPQPRPGALLRRHPDPRHPLSATTSDRRARTSSSSSSRRTS